jgi:hypothetical protein
VVIAAEVQVVLQIELPVAQVIRNQVTRSQAIQVEVHLLVVHVEAVVIVVEVLLLQVALLPVVALLEVHHLVAEVRRLAVAVVVGQDNFKRKVLAN